MFSSTLNTLKFKAMNLEFKMHYFNIMTPPTFLRFSHVRFLFINALKSPQCFIKLRLRWLWLSLFWMTLGVFFFFSTGLLQVSWATDLAKEKRWSDQIIDSLLDGEAIQLNNGSHDFLAIETQAEDAKDLAVIVLHGIGIHPDWPAVIQPLRVQLADSGWNTLSLQLPVLKNEATGKDYEPFMSDVPSRIDAGIRYMSKQGAKRIAIVAHSMGARMASYYLSHKKIYREALTETPIVVYVSIGMGIDDKNYLGKIKIPVFDIFGENDLPSVLDSAPDRKKASIANNAYRQIKVPNANHFFDEQNEALLNTVKESISKY